MTDCDQDRDGQPARHLYEVDAALVGAKVGLVFDPFDLPDIDVRHHASPGGKAVPFRTEPVTNVRGQYTWA